MVQRSGFHPYMAIRARFPVLASGFLVVLTSGTFTRAAADPFLLSVITEEATRPPLRDGVMSLDLSVEQPVEEGGSAVDPGPVSADSGSVSDDGAWRPTVEPDYWAEAFAESSRLIGLKRQKSSAPGYSIPVNHQVQYFLDRFTRERREVVDKWFGRAGRYLEMIRDTLRGHGLPEDLAFVAMIESGFNPVAVSRAGAKGLWQFMAGTARSYGLRVDQWVDERFDPEKSTLAAAAYLRDLYAEFGSWSLAQAAYNAGQMTVTRAIRSVGTKDFWALARTGFLRTETKEFVPQIHAATVIGQDPGRYGFDVGDHRPAAVEFVSVPPGTKLEAIAAESRVSMETLRTLNPVLVKGITPPGSSYRLRVPAGTSSDVLTALTAKKPGGPTTASRAETHVVKAGDTLAGIAKRYRVSLADIRQWNTLGAGDTLRPGDRLVVADLRLSAPRGRQAAQR